MENPENKLCPYCNAEIGSDAKKCKYCGEWIDKEGEIFPKELRRFNWGAFLLNWIWGIMHKKYITLLYFPACIIPIIGPIAISIWFGISGNRWAWKSQQWESMEKFNDTQRNWVKLWVILVVLSLIIALKIFLILVFIGSSEV